MLPVDLQVALLLAQTSHSPLTPTLAEQGLLSSSGTRILHAAHLWAQACYQVPPLPPPRSRPAAIPLHEGPSLPCLLAIPLGSGTARTRGKACTCQRRKTSQGCEGTVPLLLPSDMTGTLNVRQRALSQPLTLEVVGGKRPRSATRASASQPETRRQGT